MTGETWTVLDLSSQNLVNIVSIGINKSLSVDFNTLIRTNNIDSVNIYIPEENLVGDIDLSFEGVFELSGTTQSWNTENVLDYVENTLDLELEVGKTIQFPYDDGYIIMDVTGKTETTIPTKNNAQTLTRKSVSGQVISSTNTYLNVGDYVKINPDSWDILIS